MTMCHKCQRGCPECQKLQAEHSDEEIGTCDNCGHLFLLTQITRMPDLDTDGVEHFYCVACLNNEKAKFETRLRTRLGDTHEGRELTDRLAEEFFEDFRNGDKSFNAWFAANTNKVKQPVCPKCKAAIDAVQYDESGLMNFEKGEWIKEERADLEYRCPECGEKISLDETVTD